jgi:hypothetical protein
MRGMIAVAIATLIAVSPAYAAAQTPATSAEEVSAVKAMAAAIPLGSRVKVHTIADRRMTATLMNVTDEGIIVKRESRVPEPAITIRFDELTRLQRDDKRGGVSVAKAVGVGLAAGAGAILTMFMIALSYAD